MSRRTGQSGHIEKSGRWWVVRFWKDIPGQEQREHARLRICPVEGPGALGANARKRRASELIAEFNTEEYFQKANTVGVTFAEQAKVWLRQIVTRKRKPMRKSTVDNTIWPCFAKHVLPRLGALPLSECARYPTMKKFVTDLHEAGLSARTVTLYFGYAAAVVSSLENEDGDPVYPHKWNPGKLDMPVVENQRRPHITAETMAKLAQHSDPQARMLFILAAASGCRIGELLGLTINNVLDNDTTLHIVQQAKLTKLTNELKTRNAARDVDLCSEVTKLLWEFIGNRKQGLVFASRSGKPLLRTHVIQRWLHPALRAAGCEPAGMHIFRRFRVTWLRRNNVPRDLERLWIGHAAEEVGDLYSQLKEDVEFRKEVAERIGLGFSCTEKTEICEGLTAVALAATRSSC